MTQLIIIAIYLTLLLGLGLLAGRSFRGTSQDYMLASHSIGPFLLLMSLFGTTMTAFALVGSTGEAYKEGVGVYGMLASSSGIIHSLCFLVLGVKLWGFGRRYGYSTQIEFFRDRLATDGIGYLLFPILVGLIIPYLLIGVMAGGTVINKVTLGALPELFAGSGGGVPKALGSLVVCVVVLLYVFFGGMRGTAWANTFQTLVFMILGMVTFGVIANTLGERAIVAQHQGQGHSEGEAQAAASEASLLEKMAAASAQIPEEKRTRSGLSKLKFFTYLLVPLSVGMFPHLFQHWLTARSAGSFKLAVVAHPLCIMIVWVPCVMIGAWATTGLIAIPAPVDQNPNAVLPFIVGKVAGPVLGGLLTAGILAAIMSSLDSQFLAIGTMFTKDVVLHRFADDHFSQRAQVIMARLFIVAIVAVTYGLSLFEPRRVFTLGVWCFSGFSSLFPLVFASLYWRRLTAAGAYASVTAAAVSWSMLFWQSDFAAQADYSFELTVLGTTYEMMPVAAMFACSSLALVLVSLVTKPPGESTLAKFFDC